MINFSYWKKKEKEKISKKKKKQYVPATFCIFAFTHEL